MGQKNEASWALSIRLLLLVVVMAMVATGIVGATAKSAHAVPTTFTVTNTNDSGAGSLRQAILNANANNNTNEQDLINFNIPGTGVKTISPTSLLPFISEPVIINGYTQPGAVANTLDKGTNAKLLIELRGTNLSGANQFGLLFQTPNSVVKGLVINRFGNEGIVLSTSSTNISVEGNFIGTNPEGTQDLGNGSFAPGDPGVAIASSAGNNNTIGGASPAARNLISGNQLDGVRINTDNNAVVGNLIGTDKDGIAPIANSSSGVSIDSDSTGNIVGGDTPAEANTIAFNGSDGVSIFSGTGNSILSNSMFSNGSTADALGIDLGDNGITPNDPADTDVGANLLQNKPRITSARTSRKATTIKGTLNSAPNKTFTLQFFSNASGIDEGQTFIGQLGLTTDSSGNASFTFKPAQKVRKGKITATATDSASNNTSEFSTPKKVVRRR